MDINIIMRAESGGIEECAVARRKSHTFPVIRLTTVVFWIWSWFVGSIIGERSVVAMCWRLIVDVI